MASATPRVGATSTEPRSGMMAMLTPRSSNSVRSRWGGQWPPEDRRAPPASRPARPGDGKRQPAVAKPEARRAHPATAVFGEQVLAGDPQIDHVIGDKLGDVLCPNEEKIELDVAHPDRERALGLLEHQAGITQQ